jgi:hypothetical protein
VSDFPRLNLWERLFGVRLVPQLVPIESRGARRCPECEANYEPDQRYCPGCRLAVPEWRFG